MSFIIIYGLFLLALAGLVWFWVGGVDYMDKNHPDYTGGDFLNWESSETIVKFPKKEIKNIKVKVKSVKKHKPKFNRED